MLQETFRTVQQSRFTTTKVIYEAKILMNKNAPRHDITNSPCHQLILLQMRLSLYRTIVSKNSYKQDDFSKHDGYCPKKCLSLYRTIVSKTSYKQDDFSTHDGYCPKKWLQHESEELACFPELWEYLLCSFDPAQHYTGWHKYRSVASLIQDQKISTTDSFGDAQEHQTRAHYANHDNKEAPLSHYFVLVIRDYHSLEVMGISHPTINEAKAFLFDNTTEPNHLTVSQRSRNHVQNNVLNVTLVAEYLLTKQFHYHRKSTLIYRGLLQLPRLHYDIPCIRSTTNGSLVTMQLSGEMNRLHRHPRVSLSVISIIQPW